jgi:hypothetical protein
MIMKHGGFSAYLTAGTAFLGICLTAAGAQAAPQSLALVATDRPVHLSCSDGVCGAEFTAFCLQPERNAPAPGTKYTMTRKSRVAVNAFTSDGRKIALDPHESLRFRAWRGHTAIQVSLAPGLKQRLDLQSVAIELAAHVVLAPEAVPGDDNPISADELALVEGALRPAGTALVDNDPESMAAARLTNRLVNLLPGYETDAAGTAKHWRTLMVTARRDGLRPMAVRYAQNAYDLCRYYADRVVPGDMRRCLQGQHDRMMKRLNSKYWKAIRTGS